MGQSASANIGFGFSIPEKDDEHVDLGSLLAALDPSIEGEDLGGDDGIYYSYKITRELEENCPIQILNSGHHEYPQNFVAIRSSVVDTSWDSPQAFETPRDPSQDQIDAAKRLVEKLGWKWAEPQWHLLASFG